VCTVSYTANATINEPRIKAVGTVSMVIGQMFHNGCTGEVNSGGCGPVAREWRQGATSGSRWR
jgi:uncharacterized protein